MASPLILDALDFYKHITYKDRPNTHNANFLHTKLHAYTWVNENAKPYRNYVTNI